MQESRPPQSAETDDSFDAEVSDLRETGRRRLRRAMLWSARPLLGGRLSPRQRIARGLSTAATVLLALLVLTLGMRGLPNLHLFERQPPPPVVLQADAGVMSFLLDMSWSPDGKQIALFGCQTARLGPCGAVQQYAPNAVMIYNATTGKLVTRIDPDPPVLEELHALDPTDVPALPTNGILPVLDGVQVVYSSVLWSPDGRQLALPFFASVLPQAGLGLIWGGVVLVESDGTNPRALFAPNLADASPLWDMVAGKPLSLSAAAAGGTSSQEIPPALAYRWDARDVLLPQLPLASDTVPPAPPLTPVGNPDGGATFTIWQPGQILPVGGPNTAGGSSALFGYVFITDFVPWSPDGSRLAERSGRHPGAPLDMSALLVPRGHTPPHSAGSTGSGQLALFDYLPVRDLALQHLLDVGSSAASGGASGWIVAWRPDGRVLAAYGVAGGGDGAKDVMLYDCASGKTLNALSPASGSIPLDGYNGGMLRWSPDGTRLLAYVQGSGTLTVWGPAQLV